MKKNNFLEHFLVIGLGTIINLLLGLLTTPIITRLVDPIEYGKLSIFTMYSSIALMTLCLGLDQALVRYYYECKSVNEKKTLLIKCIVLPIILSVLLSISVVFLSCLSIIKFNTFLVTTLCLYTIIQIIYRFSILVIRLEYKSKMFSFLNILLKILYIILAVPLLIFSKFDSLTILIFSTTFSAFICMVVSIFFQRDIWKSDRAKNSSIKKKELLKYAYPYVFSMGITTLFQAVDKISLNIYGTYSDVGIYSSAMSLVHIFAIVQSSFNTLWTPMAVEHYTKDKEDRSFYQKGNKIITVIMFFLGISLILFKDVFSFLLGEKYREAAYILPFLIFNPIMYTISETTVSGLVFMKKSKLQVVVAIVSCLTNIVGNLILVPIFGCKGAAMSTGISYIMFFTLRTVLSNKHFYVDYELKKFYILTIIVIFYALYNTFVEFNLFSIFGYVLIIVILCILYKETIMFCFNYIIRFLRKKLKINNMNLDS